MKVERVLLEEKTARTVVKTSFDNNGSERNETRKDRSLDVATNLSVCVL